MRDPKAAEEIRNRLATETDFEAREELKVQLTEVEFSIAVAAGDEFALNSFLARYPESRFSFTALDHLERLAFGRAEREASPEGWTRFLGSWPQGHLLEPARKHWGQVACNRWSELNSLDDLEAVLRSHPSGLPCLQQLEEKRGRLRLQEALAQPGTAKLVIFLSENPGDPVASIAREALAGRQRKAMAGDGGQAESESWQQVCGPLPATDPGFEAPAQRADWLASLLACPQEDRADKLLAGLENPFLVVRWAAWQTLPKILEHLGRVRAESWAASQVVDQRSPLTPLQRAILWNWLGYRETALRLLSQILPQEDEELDLLAGWVEVEIRHQTGEQESIAPAVQRLIRALQQAAGRRKDALTPDPDPPAVGEGTRLIFFQLDGIMRLWDELARFLTGSQDSASGDREALRAWIQRNREPGR